MFGAFAEEVAVGRGGLRAHPRRRRRARPRRRSVSPTAPRTTCCARWRGSQPARSSSCSAPVAASAWPRSSSASRSGATRHRRRVVGREARRGSAVTAPTHLDRPPRRRPAPGAARRAPRRCRRRRRPGRRRPLRAGAAVAALRRSVRHRRLRVGRDPADPAEPRAGEGHPGPRLPVPGRRRRRSSSATRTSCASLLASGRVAPHIGATYPLADTAAALRHVADGRAIGKVLIDLRDRSARGRRSAATEGRRPMPQRNVSVARPTSSQIRVSRGGERLGLESPCRRAEFVVHRADGCFRAPRASWSPHSVTSVMP